MLEKMSPKAVERYYYCTVTNLTTFINACEFPPEKEETIMSINVVFEYTSEAGGYEGVRYITPFSEDEIGRLQERGNERIVARGVTDEEAEALVKETPLAAYIGAALQEAKDPNSNGMNMDLLDLKLNTSLLAYFKRDCPDIRAVFALAQTTSDSLVDLISRNPAEVARAYEDQNHMRKVRQRLARQAETVRTLASCIAPDLY